MNYESLRLQIIKYANKYISNPDEKPNFLYTTPDFDTAIPNFIEMGQQRIWRELTGVEFELTTLTKTFQIGEAYLAKPDDWNKTISFLYGTSNNFSEDAKILKERTFEFCRLYWTNSSKDKINLNNPPEFYSDVYANGFNRIGNFFFISPTPDQAYYYQLTYLRRVNLIYQEKDKNGKVVASNSNNILTDNYPDLLFYACFLEALVYLRDDERIQIYEANYQRALQSAMQKTMDRHSDRTTNRDID